MIASFALLTALQLVSFIQGFGNHLYTTWGGSLDIFRILGAFLRVVTPFYIICLATANFTSKLQQYKENLNKLWFLPAVFLVLTLIFTSYYFLYLTDLCKLKKRSARKACRKDRTFSGNPFFRPFRYRKRSGVCAPLRNVLCYLRNA